MKLRRNGELPLYRQVQQVLRDRIESGALRPGDRLPGENELARELAVNRLTVRQAIAELSRAGQIVVRHGLGTFVAEPLAQLTIPIGAQSSQGAVENTRATLRREGKVPTEFLLSTEIHDSTEAREHLRLPRQRLRRVDTRFSVDGQPWSVNTYWFADTRLRGIAEHLVEDGSVFRACHAHYGLDLRYVWRSFAAAAASPQDAEHLDVAVGTPVLVREGLNVDAEGKPTIFVCRRMHSDRVRFVLRYDLEGMSD